MLDGSVSCKLYLDVAQHHGEPFNQALDRCKNSEDRTVPQRFWDNVVASCGDKLNHMRVLEYNKPYQPHCLSLGDDEGNIFHCYSLFFPSGYTFCLGAPEYLFSFISNSNNKKHWDYEMMDLVSTSIRLTLERLTLDDDGQRFMGIYSQYLVTHRY